MAAKEIDLNLNQWCTHCLSGEGCGIHNDRSQTCRDWECLWLSQPQIPDTLRPDKCGVVFELPNYSTTYVGYVIPDRLGAWEKPDVRVFINKINKAGYSVLIIQGNEQFYSLVDGMTKEAMYAELYTSLTKHVEEGII